MRLLIVDDDPAIVESICDLVNWKKLGIQEVETAPGSVQAKQILQERPADIVISDIEMPGESGIDLLRWYREEKYGGKFLLLTCHESFSYAQEALKLRAEEYLLKPFRVDMIEMVIQKLVRSIEEEREKEAGADSQGKQKERRNTQAVLADLLTDRLSGKPEELRRELPEGNFLLEEGRLFCLAVVRMTNLEKDEEAYGKGLVFFTLENMACEILTGSPENARVVSFDHGRYGMMTVICDSGSCPEDPADTGADAVSTEKDRITEAVRNNLKLYFEKAAAMFSLTLTACIGEPVSPKDFYACFRQCEEALERDIIYYGNVFSLEEAASETGDSWRALELKTMEDFLEQKNRKGFLDYVKKELNAAVQLSIMDHEQAMRVIQEVRQAVYAHLARKGILISLVTDHEAEDMARMASRSVIDLLRWANYLLSRVFTYEEELQKSSGIIQEIDHYIEEHYSEEIGRNEIGAAFYLVPEYVAKLYKKKTGKALKDAINDYRLTRAKTLLTTSDRKVSEIAQEVGFDNFSYFSTLFKKSMGMTPNEFRKQ